MSRNQPKEPKGTSVLFLITSAQLVHRLDYDVSGKIRRLLALFKKY